MVLSELFILILFFLVFLFFRRQGFRLITFDRQGGLLEFLPVTGHGQRKKCIVLRVCVCGVFGREGGGGEIPLRHGHKESYKDLNLKNSPPSGTRTTDLMNTSLTLYQLSYQI